MGCAANKKETTKNMSQTELKNETLKKHSFLSCMYSDPYFPKFLVDKCSDILINLCNEIEQTKPQNLKELYILTHKATNQINDLQEEFFMNDSEIETGARECLAEDFEFISNAYNFKADAETLIETRDW